MAKRTNYWTKERALKMLRRATREVWGNDPSRFPVNMNRYRQDTQPFNEAYPQNKPLYPSPETLSRLCGGLQKAFKALGFNIEYRQAAHRKSWKPTPEIDARIREIYSRPILNGQNFQGGRGVKAYAEEIGWPHHAICKRAAELGVGRVKEKPWSESEIAALDELAHHVPAVIESKFRKLGFRRTEASIAVMRKRREAHKRGKWYSGHALQLLMGFSDHVVDRRWIPMGLKYILKGTTKHGRQQGDTRLYHIDEIRRFFIEHPEEIDLQKVDKWFFLEMITAGKIKMIVASPRLSIRAEAPRPAIDNYVPKQRPRKRAA